MTHRPARPRFARLAILMATLMLAPAVIAAPAAAAPPGNDAACSNRSNNTVAKLLECVTLDGVREHQAALQAIADANGGIRTSGTPGYDASVDYAVSVFEAAGYNVTVQPFIFQTFINLSPALLERVSPPPAGPISTTIFSYSGSGDVTASVSRPADAGSGNEGCEAADFAGFTAGHIALIQRGSCTFAIKATNAYNAGASAVVIWNNQPGVINGTLGNDFTLNIAVTSATQVDGAALAAATPGLVLRVRTATFRGLAETYNVLAETKGGNPNNVIMVGGHLDSVDAGPGIQDNGSGTAAILETAEQMAKVNVRNKVRFALWGAEEAGLVGSDYYVYGLTDEERAKIALYLNFDMIGSPNYVFFVYDGDGSAFGLAGPEGSGAIEKLYQDFYTSRGLEYLPTEISFRSDYAAFFDWGIPFGGLFTGAEGIKTPAQVAIWGGTAGQQYDPCYHLACDTYANINLFALDVNADAVAYSTLVYAMSTESVNGVKGKGNFKLRGAFGDDHAASTQ